MAEECLICYEQLGGEVAGMSAMPYASCQNCSKITCFDCYDKISLEMNGTCPFCRLPFANELDEDESMPEESKIFVLLAFSGLCLGSILLWLYGIRII